MPRSGKFDPGDIFLPIVDSSFMNRWHRFGLLVAALILLNIAISFILEANQKDGVYPAHADTIFIPIALGWADSLFILPQLFFLTFLTSFNFVKRLCLQHTGWLITLAFILLALYANVGLFAISGVAEWMFPKHYVIAASYSLLLLVLVIFLLLDIKLFFNSFRESLRRRIPKSNG